MQNTPRRKARIRTIREVIALLNKRIAKRLLPIILSVNYATAVVSSLSVPERKF